MIAVSGKCCFGHQFSTVGSNPMDPIIFHAMDTCKLVKACLDGQGFVNFELMLTIER